MTKVTCQDSVRGDARPEADLRVALGARFSDWLLPLEVTPAEARRFGTPGDGLRFWTQENDRALLFAAPPPPIKRDPEARPARLGQVNRRLKELRALSGVEKEALALRVIDTLLWATDSVAVSFSGGRDSLVALHLALRRKPDLTVVFINTGIEFPETVAYVRQIAKEWQLDLREARAGRSFWRLARERGLPIGGRGNSFFRKALAEAAEVKLSNACCNQLKITPARQFYRRHSIEGVVTGLRADESLMRRLNLADYGALRWSRDYGALVAWPLFAWQREDVEAYSAAHNLPLNPLYGMGHQRVGCWACLQDFLRDDSRLFTLKHTHPGMYESLKAQFGDELLRVLAAWGNVQHLDFTLEQFDGLYTPCGLDLLRPNSQQRQRKTDLTASQK